MPPPPTQTPAPEAASSEAPPYTPHELCTAAVQHVLANVNTVQYLIRSIEEVSGKAFTPDRVKCLPAVPLTYQRSPTGARAPSTQAGVLAPTQFAAGYIWSKVRPDCAKGDVVVVEDHVAALAKTHTAADSARAGSASTTAGREAGSTGHPSSSPSSPVPPILTTTYLEEQQGHVLRHVERMLRHELIHAFDDARGIVDSSNCIQQACSEIRAARLSGDCFATEEVKKGRFNLFQGGLQCVHRRATLAVDSNPVCKGFSERAVETVFKQCYSDYEPFVAPVYAMGSYGKDSFPNGSLKL